MSEVCGWRKHHKDSHRKSDGACLNIAIGGYLMSTYKPCRHPRFERSDGSREACVVCGSKRPIGSGLKVEE